MDNGIIFQFGTVECNVSPLQTKTFTFPIKFPHKCFVVTANAIKGYPDDGTISPQITDITNTSYTIYSIDLNSSLVKFNYIAIGY